MHRMSRSRSPVDLFPAPDGISNRFYMRVVLGQSCSQEFTTVVGSIDANGLARYVRKYLRRFLVARVVSHPNPPRRMVSDLGSV